MALSKIKSTSLETDATNLVLLSSATASSGDAEIEFTNLNPSTYNTIMLIGYNLLPVTDAVNLRIRGSDDNGATYKSGASDYGFLHDVRRVGNTVSEGGDNDNDEIDFHGSENRQGNQAAEISSLKMFLTNMNSQYKNIFTEVNGENLAGNYSFGHNAGQMKFSGACNAIKLFWSTGNWSSGTINCYGIKN